MAVYGRDYFNEVTGASFIRDVATAPGVARAVTTTFNIDRPMAAGLPKNVTAMVGEYGTQIPDEKDPTRISNYQQKFLDSKAELQARFQEQRKLDMHLQHTKMTFGLDRAERVREFAFTTANLTAHSRVDPSDPASRAATQINYFYRTREASVLRDAQRVYDSIRNGIDPYKIPQTEHIRFNKPNDRPLEQELTGMLNRGKGSVFVATASLTSRNVAYELARRAGSARVDVAVGLTFVRQEKNKNKPLTPNEVGKDGVTYAKFVADQTKAVGDLFRPYLSNANVAKNLKVTLVDDLHANYFASLGNAEALGGSGRASSAIGPWSNKALPGHKAGSLEMYFHFNGREHAQDVYGITNVLKSEIAGANPQRLHVVNLSGPQRPDGWTKAPVPIRTYQKDNLGLDTLLHQLQASKYQHGYGGSVNKWYVQFDLPDITRKALRLDKGARYGGGIATYLYRQAMAYADQPNAQGVGRSAGTFSLDTDVGKLAQVIDHRLAYGKSFGEEAWGQVGSYGWFDTGLHNWAKQRDREEYDRLVREQKLRGIGYRQTFARYDEDQGWRVQLVSTASKLDSLFLVLGGFQAVGMINRGLVHPAVQRFSDMSEAVLEAAYHIPRDAQSLTPARGLRALGGIIEAAAFPIRTLGLFMSKVSGAVLENTPFFGQGVREAAFRMGQQETVAASSYWGRETRRESSIARGARAIIGMEEAHRLPGLEPELALGRQLGRSLKRNIWGWLALGALGNLLVQQAGRAKPIPFEKQLEFSNAINAELAKRDGGKAPIRFMFTAGFDPTQSRALNLALMPIRFIRATAHNVWNMWQDSEDGFAPNVADTAQLLKAAMAGAEAQELQRTLETGRSHGRQLSQRELWAVERQLVAYRTMMLEANTWRGQTAVGVGQPMLAQFGSAVIGSVFAGIEQEVQPYADVQQISVTRYKFVAGLGIPFMFRGGHKWESPFIIERVTSGRPEHMEFQLEELGTDHSYNVKFNPDGNLGGLIHWGALTGGIYLAGLVAPRNLAIFGRDEWLGRFSSFAVNKAKWLNPIYFMGSMAGSVLDAGASAWHSTVWQMSRAVVPTGANPVAREYVDPDFARRGMVSREAFSNPGTYVRLNRADYLATPWNYARANARLEESGDAMRWAMGQANMRQRAMHAYYKLLEAVWGRGFTGMAIGMAVTAVAFGYYEGWKEDQRALDQGGIHTADGYLEDLHTVDTFFRSTPVRGLTGAVAGTFDLMARGVAYIPWIGGRLAAPLHFMGQWFNNLGESWVVTAQMATMFQDEAQPHEVLGNRNFRRTSRDWWGGALLAGMRGYGSQVSLAGMFETSLKSLVGMGWEDSYTGPKNKFLGAPEGFGLGAGISFSNLDPQTQAIRNGFLRWSPTNMGDLTVSDTTTLRAYINKQAEAIVAEEIRELSHGSVDFRSPVRNPLRPPRVSGVMFLGNSPVANASPILRAALEERYRMHSWAMGVTGAQLQRSFLGPWDQVDQFTRTGRYHYAKQGVSLVSQANDVAHFMLTSLRGAVSGDKGPLTSYDLSSMLVGYLNAQTAQVRAGSTEVAFEITQDYASENQFKGLAPTSVEAMAGASLHHLGTALGSLMGMLGIGLTGVAALGLATVWARYRFPRVNAALNRLDAALPGMGRVGRAFQHFVGFVPDTDVMPNARFAFHVQESLRADARLAEVVTHRTGVVTLRVGSTFYVSSELSVFGPGGIAELRGMSAEQLAARSQRIMERAHQLAQRANLGVAGLHSLDVMQQGRFWGRLIPGINAEAFGGSMLESTLRRLENTVIDTAQRATDVLTDLIGTEQYNAIGTTGRRHLNVARRGLRESARQLSDVSARVRAGHMTAQEAAAETTRLMDRMRGHYNTLHGLRDRLAGVHRVETMAGALMEMFGMRAGAPGEFVRMANAAGLSPVRFWARMLFMLPQTVGEGLRFGQRGAQAATALHTAGGMEGGFWNAVRGLFGGGRREFGGAVSGRYNVARDALNTVEEALGMPATRAAGRLALGTANVVLRGGLRVAWGALRGLMTLGTVQTAAGLLYSVAGTQDRQQPAWARRMYAEASGRGAAVLTDMGIAYLAHRMAPWARRHATHALEVRATARAAAAASSTAASRAAAAAASRAALRWGIAARATNIAGWISMGGLAFNFGYEWALEKGWVGRDNQLAYAVFGRKGLAGIVSMRWLEEPVADLLLAAPQVLNTHRLMEWGQMSAKKLMNDITTAQLRLEAQRRAGYQPGLSSHLQSFGWSMLQGMVGMMEPVVGNTFQPYVPGTSLSMTNAVIAQVGWAWRGAQKDWAMQGMATQERVRQSYEIGASLNLFVDPRTMGAVDASGGEFIQLSDAPGGIYQEVAGLGIYGQRVPRIGTKYLRSGQIDSLLRRLLQLRAGYGDFALARHLRPFGTAKNIDRYDRQLEMDEATAKKKEGVKKPPELGLWQRMKQRISGWWGSWRVTQNGWGFSLGDLWKNVSDGWGKLSFSPVQPAYADSMSGSYYTGGLASGFRKQVMTTNPGDGAAIAAAIEREAARHGLDVNVFAAMGAQESGFNRHARSGVGAKGIYQFMPGTWKTYGHGGDREDPLASVRGGAEYMAHNIAMLGNLKWASPFQKSLIATMMHNSGEYLRIYQTARSWDDLLAHVPAETRNHVNRILERMRAVGVNGPTVQASDAGQPIPGSAAMPVGGYGPVATGNTMLERLMGGRVTNDMLSHMTRPQRGGTWSQGYDVVRGFRLPIMPLSSAGGVRLTNVDDQNKRSGGFYSAIDVWTGVNTTYSHATYEGVRRDRARIGQVIPLGTGFGEVGGTGSANGFVHVHIQAYDKYGRPLDSKVYADGLAKLNAEYARTGQRPSAGAIADVIHQAYLAFLATDLRTTGGRGGSRRWEKWIPPEVAAVRRQQTQAQTHIDPAHPGRVTEARVVPTAPGQAPQVARVPVLTRAPVDPAQNGARREAPVDPAQVPWRQVN